jgi:amino acid transporter
MALNTGSRSENTVPPGQRLGLARTLSLGHAVLYGLGVTIGAGIYVLVGPAIGRAGDYAPLAFVLAAAMLSLTGASIAELGSRMPVAAGEAAFVRAGFGSDRLATLTGLIVFGISTVSAAAISVGSAGYIGTLIDVPRSVIIAGVVLTMGGIAAVGIRESVTFAGIMTVIEIGGLVMIVLAGAVAPAIPPQIGPPSEPITVSFPLAGLMSATLLAVFAFIGFESLTNIAEEMRRPKRDLPLAIFITLFVTTALYVTVVWVALRTVPAAELDASDAPLTLVFERTIGADPRLMTLIAIVATVNGVIVQIIMSARVLYGLSVQGSLHPLLGAVHGSTRTPHVATALAVVAATVLALFIPLDQLADLTSRLTLALFALVNASLIAIKRAEHKAPPGIFSVPQLVPSAGIVTIVGILVAEALQRI